MTTGTPGAVGAVLSGASASAGKLNTPLALMAETSNTSPLVNAGLNVKL